MNVSEWVAQNLDLGTLVSSNVKIVLEQWYDILARNPKFSVIRNLSSHQRAAIAETLAFLMAALDSKLPNDGVLKKAFRQVAIDFGPEMGKRIINGDRWFLDFRSNIRNSHEDPEWKQAVDETFRLINPEELERMIRAAVEEKLGSEVKQKPEFEAPKDQGPSSISKLTGFIRESRESLEKRNKGR